MFNKKLALNKNYLYIGLIVFLSTVAYYCLAHDKGVDFYTYLMAAKGFHANSRAYLDLFKLNYFYYYPPLTAQLIWPLIGLPPKLAYLIWFMMSALATAIGVYLLTGNKQHFPYYLIFAFGFTPVITTLYAGQINAGLFLALCLAYYGVSKNQNLLTGLGIAAGIMLKIIPIAHFCYFVWRGKIKIVLAILGFLGLFFFLSLPLVGWQGWRDFFHLVTLFGNPATAPAEGFNGSPGLNFNQALSGLMARLVDNNLLSLKIWQVSSACLVLMTGFICWPRNNFNKLFDLEFSLITIAINLAMPYTWYYQFMVLLIPLLIILQRAQHEPFFRRLIAPIIIGYLLTDFQGCFWHHLHNPLLLSLSTFFAVFLWAILGIKIIMIKLSYRNEYSYSSSSAG